MFQERTDKQVIKSDAYDVIVRFVLLSVNVAKSCDIGDVQMEKCHQTLTF